MARHAGISELPRLFRLCFQFGVPKPLFEVRIAANSYPDFAVSQDGRFLLPALVEQEAPTPMTVVLNWPELLKKK
jgi:hypothetical protein